MSTPADGPRVVVVVGGSSGIGRAAAQAFASQGDRLVLASRGKAALELAAAECRVAGARSVTVLPLDVRDGLAVQRLVDAVVAEHGRIDALCHTAGVVAYGRFEDVPAEIFDAVLATNLTGAANVARSVLPVVRMQKRGSLILVGSVIGDIAAPSMTAYAVSKHAVRSLGRQLALENRDLPDVHITVLSPGGVDTPIYRQAANYQGRVGRPPPPVDSAAKVARAIVAAVDRPRDRINVGAANPLMRVGFTVLPKIFDALVGPIFRATAMKADSCPPTSGNVLEPREDYEAVSGGEATGLADLLGRLGGRSEAGDTVKTTFSDNTRKREEDQHEPRPTRGLGDDFRRSAPSAHP